MIAAQGMPHFNYRDATNLYLIDLFNEDRDYHMSLRNKNAVVPPREGSTISLESSLLNITGIFLNNVLVLRGQFVY